MTGDCRWRARQEFERGRRGDKPTVETKLKQWGECTDQGSLFEDEDLLTREIRESRVR